MSVKTTYPFSTGVRTANYGKLDFDADTDRIVKSVPDLLYRDLRDYRYELVKQAFRQPNDVIWSLLVKFVNYANDLYSRSISQFGSIAVKQVEDTARDTISQLISGLDAKINEEWSGAVDSISSTTNSILENVDNAWTEVSDFVDGVWNYFGQTYDQAIESVKTTAEQVERYVEQLVIEGQQKVSEIALDVSDYFDRFYEGLIGEAANLYNVVVEKIHDIAEENAGNQKLLLLSMNAEIEQISETTQEGIKENLSQFGDFSEELDKSVNPLFRTLSDDIVPLLKDILKEGATPPWLRGYHLGPEQNKYVTQQYSSYYEELMDPNDDFVLTLRRFLTEKGGDTLIGGFVLPTVQFLVACISFVQGLNVLAMPKITKATHKVNSDYPVADFSLNEAAGLFKRGFISESEAKTAALKEGYDNVKFDKIVEGYERAMDIGQAIEALNRGFIDEKAFKQIGKKNNLNDDIIDVFLRLRFRIPGIQDLITMAVREVFTPSIRTEYQLDGDYPEQLTEYGKKLGLSEDWSKNYWAAHWRLPSSNQGFEMFHRDIITEPELKTLLRALDIMPAWRDRMIKLNYNPITRVDIRRIYKLGLITRDNVFDRYRYLGYSPDDAELLTRFTEVYSGPDDEDPDILFKDGTQAQVKKLWELGTVDDKEAVAFLVNTGVKQSTAVLLVESWTDEDNLKFREQLINKKVQKAIREEMDQIAVDKLFSDMNLTKMERYKVEKILEVEKHEYDSIPTKSELEKMYKAGYISKTEWQDAMRKHGYSWEWIDRYFMLISK